MGIQRASGGCRCLISFQIKSSQPIVDPIDASVGGSIESTRTPIILTDTPYNSTRCDPDFAAPTRNYTLYAGCNVRIGETLVSAFLEGCPTGKSKKGGK